MVSLSGADRIRSKVLLAFEQAEELAALEFLENRSPQIQKLLTFVLVGAGTVGVEMASTLAEMSRMALAHDFHHIDARSARILLYEMAPRVLPSCPEVLSARTQHDLKRLGVKVYTSTLVTSVDAVGIALTARCRGRHCALVSRGFSLLLRGDGLILPQISPAESS